MPPAPGEHSGYPDSGRYVRLGRTVVIAAACVYAVVLSVVTISRFRGYQTALFDMGAFEQSFWNTLHGRLFENSIDPISRTYLGNHFSPGLLLMVLPYAFLPRTETLLVMQTVLLAAAAVPIYMLAVEWARSAAAGAAVAVAYLLSPVTQGANVFDVHETAMVPLLTSLTLLFLHRRRGGPAFWTSFALMLLAKDEMVLVGLAIAAFAAVAYRRWRLAAVAAAVCVLWAGLVFGVLLPALGDQGVQLRRFSQRYPDMGGSPSAMVRTVLTDPATTLSVLGDEDKVSFYWKLVAPFAYLPLAGGWALLLAAPMGFVNGLTSYFPQYDVSHHYNAVQGAVLALAAARGIGGLTAVRTSARPWVIAIATIAVLASSVTATFTVGLASGKANFSAGRLSGDDELARYAQPFKTLVPEDASLSADNLLGSHFTRRRSLVEFPERPHGDYILLLTDPARISPSNASPVYHGRYIEAIQELLDTGHAPHAGADDPSYVIVRREGPVVLLRREDLPPASPGEQRAPPAGLALVAAAALLTAIALLLAQDGFRRRVRPVASGRSRPA